MKVTTERLPKSLLALDIELDRDQVEKGLDRAARRISQKVNIPGFRKGKAPRFIVENYFGRGALIEEASDDLINRSFREALEQNQIEPVGKASLEDVHFDEEPFHFRVTVPVPPTVTLPDYQGISVPLEVPAVADDEVEQALKERRERHVVLREPEEPRPAQAGDLLTVKLETTVDGEQLEQRGEDEETPDSELVLEAERLVPGLFEGLQGIQTDETREIPVHMPEDHANEQVRGKDVVFKVQVKRIQERLLPEWDELPVLEEFEGTLDELRAKTRAELEERTRKDAERATIDNYVKQLVEQTEYDIPDAMIEHEADHLLEEQGQSFQRYGITLDQMLQYRGKSREEARDELLPQAEERLKNTLALGEVVRREGLSVNDTEIDQEVEKILGTYDETERERARQVISNPQLRSTVANSVLNQKLQDRLLQLATGTTPASDGEAVEATANAAQAADATQE
ncbi:MAG TPA: trigger factor [Roseiflexaceae bacterium]|nr:trigger factor [Roseiflexaceae bacterium]